MTLQGPGSASVESVRSAHGVLTAQGMDGLLEEWYVETLQRRLQRDLVPRFWAHFRLPAGAPGVSPPDKPSHVPLAEAVDTLSADMQAPLAGAALLQELAAGCLLPDGRRDRHPPLVERVQTMLRALLFDRTPKCFQAVVHAFYERAFRAFHGLKRGGCHGNELKPAVIHASWTTSPAL